MSKARAAVEGVKFRESIVLRTGDTQHSIQLR
jgi:hypothetical protein